MMMTTERLRAVLEADLAEDEADLRRATAERERTSLERHILRMRRALDALKDREGIISP